MKVFASNVDTTRASIAACLFVVAVALGLSLTASAAHAAQAADSSTSKAEASALYTTATSTENSAAATPANTTKTTKPAKPAQPTIKKLSSAHGGKAYIEVSKVANAKGYEFRVSKDKTFKKGVKRATVSKRAHSFRMLDQKEKYYAQVRAYTIVNGKKVWSAWSKRKSVKVRQFIVGFVGLRPSTGSGTGRWLRRTCGFKVLGISSVDDPDLKRVDGVVVPGGADVNPKYYGEKKGKYTVLENPKRGLLKLRVIRKCAKIKKPLLGICGGEQSLNVALGGSLVQHIPGGYHRGFRYVKVKKGSWLYGMFGKKTKTQHSHHQCVKRLGKGLIATQWDAKDGYIEAIEHETLPLYGVQWHPENMGKKGVRVAKSFARICMRNA